MAKTYCMCQGMRGEATRRGGNDGVHVAAQSWEGSVIVRNWYDGEDKVHYRISTNDGSSCYGDYQSNDLSGTFDEIKEAMKLLADIREGRVSVVRHRKKK